MWCISFSLFSRFCLMSINVQNGYTGERHDWSLYTTISWIHRQQQQKLHHRNKSKEKEGGNLLSNFPLVLLMRKWLTHNMVYVDTHSLIQEVSIYNNWKSLKYPLLVPTLHVIMVCIWNKIIKKIIEFSIEPLG